jgi:hypothetical protein
MSNENKKKDIQQIDYSKYSIVNRDFTKPIVDKEHRVIYNGNLSFFENLKLNNLL